MLGVVQTADDISLYQMIERNKSLANIERGFRVLKSETEIGPVYHWLPDTSARTP